MTEDNPPNSTPETRANLDRRFAHGQRHVGGLIGDLAFDLGVTQSHAKTIVFNWIKTRPYTVKRGILHVA